MTKNIKKCAFFGHRTIEISADLINKLWQLIEDLVVSYEVYTFLFGSNSEFDDLCYKIVSELKKKYPHIRRVQYTCGEEKCILINRQKELGLNLSDLKDCGLEIKVFEEEVKQRKNVSKKAMYVERNKRMIDDSDMCIIYYLDDYIVKKNNVMPGKNFKSGTQIVYNYLNEKKKLYFNLVETINSL